MQKKWIMLLVFFFSISFANAALIDSFSIGVGGGNPNNLRGGRIALQKNWNIKLLPLLGFYTTGYWDANFAYFHTQGDQFGRYKNIAIIGINPVFRFRPTNAIYGIVPYLEASVGLAAYNHRRLGHRNLGMNWSFEDLLGFGATFGDRQQYDLSLHFLHFSNADIKRPNNGIDVKILAMFRYFFQAS